jgi:hypothetical protein
MSQNKEVFLFFKNLYKEHDKFGAQIIKYFQKNKNFPMVFQIMSDESSNDIIDYLENIFKSKKQELLKLLNKASDSFITELICNQKGLNYFENFLGRLVANKKSNKSVTSPCFVEIFRNSCDPPKRIVELYVVYKDSIDDLEYYFTNEWEVNSKKKKENHKLWFKNNKCWSKCKNFEKFGLIYMKHDKVFDKIVNKSVEADRKNLEQKIKIIAEQDSIKNLWQSKIIKKCEIVNEKLKML